MLPINEKLLSTWLKLSTSVVNARITDEFPYNESLVCNMLYMNSLQDNSEPLTATDLCNKTRMLKSQMNRTLNFLEEKEIITRQRSKDDKRQVYIIFNAENAEPYMKQHEKILPILDEIIARLGEEKTKDLIQTLTYIADIADDIINEPPTGGFIE